MEVALTYGLGLAILLASPSLSPDILDSLGHAPPGMVSRLTEECVRKGQVRIVARELDYLVRIDRLNTEGVGGFKVRGSNPPPPDPMAWPLITRTDAVHTRRGVGMLTGAIAGGAVGWPLQSIVLGASLGATVGGYMGSARVREVLLYVAQPGATARLPLDSTATGPQVADPSRTAAGPSDSSTAGTHEPPVERIREACAEISPGSTLRVTFATMTLAEGKVTRADDAGLYGWRPTQPQGSTPAQPDLIPWARILKVEERVGSSRRGAVYGGVSFGFLGALLTAAVVASGGIGGGVSYEGSAIVAGAVTGGFLGAGLGMGLGAMIGAAVPRWHVVY